LKTTDAACAVVTDRPTTKAQAKRMERFFFMIVLLSFGMGFCQLGIRYSEDPAL
jgi:hypothetical protein